MKTMRNNVGRIVSVGVVGVALLALGILGVGAAVAEEEGEERGSGRCRGQGGGKMMAVVADMDLDDDQRARLDNARSLMREQRKERRGRGGPGFDIVSDALETGELDPDEIHTRIDEKFDAKRATAHAVADEMIAFFEGLDEEQRASLAEQIDERRSQRSERRMRRGSCAGDEDGDRSCCRGGRHGRGGPPAADDDDE